MALPNDFDKRLHWLLDYFNFPIEPINFSKIGTGLTGDDFLNIYWYENDFGVLMLKVVNIELSESLIAEFPMPDNEDDFKRLMKIFKL